MTWTCSAARTDMRLLLVVMCVLVLNGCGLTEGIDTAERAAATFHEQYNAGAFDETYDASADDLRATEVRNDFMTTMASVRTKLGSMRATRRTGFNARVDSSGTFVELEYETDFENGTGTEEFTWEISNGRAKLLSYNVSSKALLR
jgi:hypothetical protein